jgi:hypothetical protein
LNQAYFLEFRQVSLNVDQGLFRAHFVMRGNPIRQFLRGLPAFEQSPQVSSDLIEGVDRLEIADALANGNDYRFISDFAGHYGGAPGVTHGGRSWPSG